MFEHVYQKNQPFSLAEGQSQCFCFFKILFYLQAMINLTLLVVSIIKYKVFTNWQSKALKHDFVVIFLNYGNITIGIKISF
jgi:hypothetical protein